MTRDQIIAMAREAGFEQAGHESHAVFTSGIERFASLVAASEREACALSCEKTGMEGYGTLAAAAAICARGQS